MRTRLKRIARILVGCCHVIGTTAVTRSLMAVSPLQGETVPQLLRARRKQGN